MHSAYSMYTELKKYITLHNFENFISASDYCE